MPISISDVKEGACYEAGENNQHRRVVKIIGSRLTYESWSGNIGPRPPLDRISCDIATFAEACIDSVTCDARLPAMPVL